MALSNGPNLGLLVNAAQGEAHFAAQQKLLRGLDALVQPSVKDKDLATPPPTPADGDRYIVAAAPTGAWVGHAAEIARWSSVATAWEFYVPKAGWRMYVEDEGLIYTHNGTVWSITITRKIILPGEGTATTAWAWPDSITSLLTFLLFVPDDYVSGDLTFKILRRAAAAAGTTRMQRRSFRFRDATAILQIDSNVNMDMAFSDAGSHLSTFTIAAANFVVGDVVRVALERLGMDAADTTTGFVDFDGGWAEYTGRA